MMNTTTSLDDIFDASHSLVAIGISTQTAADLQGAFVGHLSGLSSMASALSDDDFTGKTGSVCVYPTFGQISASRVIFVGTGDGGLDAIRRAAGMVGKTARKHAVESVGLDFGPMNEVSACAAVEGFWSGNYLFDRYKNEKKKKAPAKKLTLHQTGTVDLKSAIAIGHGQRLSRDLVNEPAAVIYPESLAESATALADDCIRVDVWDENRIAKEGMGGIIGVGQGSANPPRFIHLHYRPTTTPTRTIAIVGKGVTFDSGGLSLKTSTGMLTMRCDMGGSAVVLGVMRAIKQLRPNVEVHGIIGAVENMCAANSYKLGDILHIRNGKTVEVHNTDAEGRLVLADCLSYASELKPDVIVDLATLTGACVVALGEYYTGLFTSNDELATDLIGASNQAGEGLWRMPLPPHYSEMLKADWGDIKNVGGRAGGSITAALFLSEFVDEAIPWAHCDIAGPTFLSKPFRHMASGGTGAMVSTLTRWLND